MRATGYWIGTLCALSAVFASIGSWSSDARADVLCNIADPEDPTLNVRETPGGKVVNRLPNGRVVREDEKKGAWSSVSSGHRGEWRNWGWVFNQRMKCVDTNRFPRETVSVRDLKSVGILPQTAMNTKALAIGCEQIPNGWGVSISEELFGEYRRRGFSKTAACLALGSSGVNFDPETGRRLPLYDLDDGAGLRPLWVPDCYREVTVVGRGGYLIGWRPTGCTLRYHPSTGIKIDDPAVVELTAGGEAGGAADEDRPSKVSSDRLKALVSGK
jgi:hypothetical protein